MEFLISCPLCFQAAVGACYEVFFSAFVVRVFPHCLQVIMEHLAGLCRLGL